MAVLAAALMASIFSFIAFPPHKKINSAP